MSTRYVWDKHNVLYGYKWTPGTSKSEYIDSFSNTGISFSTDYVTFIPESGVSEQYGLFDPNTGKIRDGYQDYMLNMRAEEEYDEEAEEYYPVADSGFFIGVVLGKIENRIIDPAKNRIITISSTWSKGQFSYEIGNGYIRIRPITGSYLYYASAVTLDGTMGDFISRLTTATYGAYTQGVNGDIFYNNVGSDNVDPYSVSYSVSEPADNLPVTISLSPRTGTYGGTLTYRYEVQINGGAWTYLTSTTATSKAYTMPAGTRTFRARVKVSDDMGFTSNDYVYGDVLKKPGAVCVGVNGTVKLADPVACIGGSIKTNTYMVACVGGTIKEI